MQFFIEHTNQPLSRVVVSVSAPFGAAPLFARVDYARGTVVISQPPHTARPGFRSMRARRRVLAGRRGQTPIPITNRNDAR